MIRIGLIGAAWITPMAILEPAKLLPNAEVVAIAARDPVRARIFANEHGIAEVEETYEALLLRPDLDLVYIALPVSLHAQWAELALTNGKHVLCEKPLVMNARQAQHLAQVSASTGRFLIEAFHYVYHPYFKCIQQIIKSKELGVIEEVTGRLHVPVPPKEGQIRHDPSMGGGALMDLGCYPIHMMRTLFDTAPKVVKSEMVMGASGVDLSIKAELALSDGIVGFLDCSMPETGELLGELIIVGTEGKLHGSKPILPHLGGVLQVETAEGRRAEKSDTRSTFYYQLKAVVNAIQDGEQPLISMLDSIGNATVLDDIRTCAN